MLSGHTRTNIMNTNTTPVHIIGGGLAGSEAAWQVCQSGIPVVIHEMRPTRSTDAHQTSTLAELVCSNSFRSTHKGNAIGLLKAEMRQFGSLIMQAAEAALQLSGRADQRQVAEARRAGAGAASSRSSHVCICVF